MLYLPSLLSTISNPLPIPLQHPQSIIHIQKNKYTHIASTSLPKKHTPITYFQERTALYTQNYNHSRKFECIINKGLVRIQKLSNEYKYNSYENKLS